MDKTLVTLEDRELSAVRGGWGHGFGCGGGGGFGFGGFGGYGYRRFGFGGYDGGGYAVGGCGLATGYEIVPAVSTCDTGCGSGLLGDLL